MAVTVAELAVALRLIAAPTDTLDAGPESVLTRLLGVGEAMTDLLIPTAPQAIQDECIVRLAAYLYDQPIGRRDAYANAWINSGAGALASRWQQQAVSGSTASAATAPGAGVDEAAVQALIDMVIPPPRQADVGKVFSVGSDLARFWDSPRDVLLRSLGPLAGKAGQVLRVNAAADDVELHSIPAAQGGGQTAQQVEDAIAAAVARYATLRQVQEAVHGLTQKDVDTVRQLENDTTLVDTVSTKVAIGLQSSQVDDPKVIGYSASPGAIQGTYFVYLRVLLTDLDDVEIERGYLRITPSQDGLVEQRQIWALFPEVARDATYSYRHNNISIAGIDTNMDTVRFIERVATVKLALGHLADAVVARLLPTGQANGQFLGVSSGAPAWVAPPAAPAAGGGATLLGSVASFAMTTTWKSSGLVLPSSATWAFFDFGDVGGDGHQGRPGGDISAAHLRGITPKGVAGHARGNNGWAQIGQVAGSFIYATLDSSSNILLAYALGSGFTASPLRIAVI